MTRTAAYPLFSAWLAAEATRRTADDPHDEVAAFLACAASAFPARARRSPEELRAYVVGLDNFELIRLAELTGHLYADHRAALPATATITAVSIAPDGTRLVLAVCTRDGLTVAHGAGPTSAPPLLGERESHCRRPGCTAYQLVDDLGLLGGAA